MRPVNLLPQERGPVAGGGLSGSAYAIVGGLAVVVAAALLYVLTLNDLNAKKEDIARVKADTAVAQQRAAGLQAYASFAGIKQARLGAVTSLAQARIDWERLMRELALVIPESSHVQSAEATSGASTAGGAPGSPSLKLIGCAKRGHREVADLLVRLRKLYRAQDVQLRDSDEGSGDGSSCGKGAAAFTAEVTFSPAPASEVPRGESKVPASLGGGS